MITQEEELKNLSERAAKALRYDPVWRGAIIPINDEYLRERIERAWTSIQTHGWRLVGERYTYVVGDKYCTCCKDNMDEAAIIVALEYSALCQLCGTKICKLMHRHYTCDCNREVVCRACSPRMGHRPRCSVCEYIAQEVAQEIAQEIAQEC